MLGNIVGWLVLLAVTVLFGWLVVRAWHVRRALVRWPATVLAGLFTLVLAAATVLTGIGLYRLYAPVTYPVADLNIAGTAEQIARGQRLASQCAGCHSSTGELPLDGANKDFLAGGPPLGAFYAPNLTPAGDLKNWTDGQIVRAIREGVGRDNQPLLVMPSVALRHLSDDDVQALVAYLRSQPAVNHTNPGVKPNLMGVALLGSGMFDTSLQPHIDKPVPGVQPGITPAYGGYLVSISGCSDCHGAQLTGMNSPFTGSAPNIAAIVPQWDEAGFVRTIRTGVDPIGHQLSDAMPWKDFNKSYTDDELKAIYAYLAGLQSATQK